MSLIHNISTGDGMNATDVTERETIEEAADKAYELLIGNERREEARLEEQAKAHTKRAVIRAFRVGKLKPTIQLGDAELTRFTPSDRDRSASCNAEVRCTVEIPNLTGEIELRAFSKFEQRGWSTTLVLAETCSKCKESGWRNVSITGLGALGKALDGEGDVFCAKHWTEHNAKRKDSPTV